VKLTITKGKLDGVLLIQPKVFGDDRGFFMESYNAAELKEAGVDILFVQDNHSKSCKNVLRGLHYQVNREQDKLVRVLSGEVFDVAVDIRRNSPTFGLWEGYLLSDENKNQLLIPKGFAHGFCVLSETAEFLYKCSDYYSPEDERGIIWNDTDINIDWPVSDPILSERDKKLPLLKNTGFDF